MKRWQLALGVIGLVALGCSKTPAEPERSAAAPTSPAVQPLVYEVPGAWTALEAPRTGPKKAMYKVARTGDDKEEAELTVVFFGTGSGGDEDTRFSELFALFDGDVGKTAVRESFDVGAMKVETFDVVGTYKVALAPPMRGKKQSPIQMVKNRFRMLGAVVKTKDRGNWFFKLVGPDETVQAARSSFRAMLDSVK